MKIGVIGILMICMSVQGCSDSAAERQAKEDARMKELYLKEQREAYEHDKKLLESMLEKNK